MLSFERVNTNMFIFKNMDKAAYTLSYSDLTMYDYKSDLLLLYSYLRTYLECCNSLISFHVTDLVELYIS